MRRRASIVAVVLVGLAGAGIVLAQDPKKEKPLIATSELQQQCENAIKSKAYLKDLKVTFREEGTGKICCEGAVPTKVHACALYLTCMSLHGVACVDVSKLRIEHWGSETTTPSAKPGPRPGTDVLGGLDKAIADKRLGMYAVILNPDEKGVTTQPAGARTFVQNDVIVIGDVPMSALPDKKAAPLQGNPSNQNPDKNTQTPARDQPVAPHNPGAYPDAPK